MTPDPWSLNAPVEIRCSRSNQLRENIAFAQNLDVFAIDFNVGPSVFAEQHFIADANAHLAPLAAVEQSPRACRLDLPALRLLLGGVRQNDSTSSGGFGIERFHDDTIIERL